MSKVYEALRQKEHENSTSTGDQAITLENAAETWESLPFNPELRAALGIAEEERSEAQNAALPFHAPATVPASEPDSSANRYPRLSAGSWPNSRLVFQADPHGLAAEQFRFLRRTLEQKFPKGATLLITSPAPKDGKSLTSLNLSCCLADSGASTLLAEADIRQPSLRKLLGCEAISTGIEEALAGAIPPAMAVHFVQELSLHVAMVANTPADPSRLISGTGLKQLLSWAREQFNWIVIDSPPVLPAADVSHLMPLADAVLAVVRTHSTPRELTVRAFEILGNRLSGVVLNGATIECNPYYRYLSNYREKGSAPVRRESAAANSDDKASQGS